MPEINYAEFEQQVNAGELTLSECRRMGATHKSYGWGRCGRQTDPKQQTAEQIAAYNNGYDGIPDDLGPKTVQEKGATDGSN